MGLLRSFDFRYAEPYFEVSRSAFLNFLPLYKILTSHWPPSNYILHGGTEGPNAPKWGSM